MAVDDAAIDALARRLLEVANVNVPSKRLWAVVYLQRKRIGNLLAMQWGVDGLVLENPLVCRRQTDMRFDSSLGTIRVKLYPRWYGQDSFGDELDPSRTEEIVTNAVRALGVTGECEIALHAMYTSRAAMLAALVLVYLDARAPLSPPPRAGNDVLSRILARLDDRDRRAAACVCRDWRNAATDPLLVSGTSCLAARLRLVTRTWGPIATTVYSVCVAEALARRWFGETS